MFVSRLVPFALVWVAGLVAGLLVRSAASSHGALATLVIVATTAGALGLAAALTRRAS
jgi:hypothetical protein